MVTNSEKVSANDTSFHFLTVGSVAAHDAFDDSTTICSIESKETRQPASKKILEITILLCRVNEFANFLLRMGYSARSAFS